MSAAPTPDSRPRKPRCPGYARHWFAVHGWVGLRSPVCVRCGAENPKELTTDDWLTLGSLFPQQYGATAAAVRESMEQESP